MNELGNTPADKNYKPSGISKAEERAQAYENGLDYYHYTGDNPSVAYKAGYEQAEKDTIDRACKWLEENVVIYPHADNKPLCIINLDTFRKAMEEDQ